MLSPTEPLYFKTEAKVATRQWFHPPHTPPTPGPIATEAQGAHPWELKDPQPYGSSLQAPVIYASAVQPSSPPGLIEVSHCGTVSRDRTVLKHLSNPYEAGGPYCITAHNGKQSRYKGVRQGDTLSQLTWNPTPAHKNIWMYRQEILVLRRHSKYLCNCYWLM